MEIIEMSKNVDKKRAYQLTHAMQTSKVQDAVDSVLPVSAWVRYNDIDNTTGEVKEVVVIESEGEIFGTISKTFIREFVDILQTFGEDDDLAIKVVQGTSKAGRKFVSCEIV